MAGVPWNPRRGHVVERMVSMPTRRAAAAAPVVTTATAKARPVPVHGGFATPSSPSRAKALAARAPYPNGAPVVMTSAGSPRMQPRGMRGELRGPETRASVRPVWRTGTSPGRSHSADALPPGPQAAAAAGYPRRRESPRGAEATAARAREREREDPLSRTHGSGVDLLAEALKAAPLHWGGSGGPPSSEPRIARCVSAKTRPKRSPQRQVSGRSSQELISPRAATRGISGSVSERRSERAESASLERCPMPESPRDQMRGFSPGESPDGPRGLEQALLDRIAALEAQVIDRKGLLQKISKQQEQLDRLESLAKENAMLKAQVARKPSATALGAAVSTGRTAAGRRWAEPNGLTLTPRRTVSPKADGRVARCGSGDLRKPPASPQAALSAGQLVTAMKASGLESRLEELEAALGLVLEER
ncbi:unnamed protein product [Effrenium voratum]|nr:unnamed protein product [Effrenium voratum]